MENNRLISFIRYIKQLGYVSISIAVLFLTFYLMRGVNIFANYGRLLFVLALPLSIIIGCNYLLKKLDNKK